MDYVTLDYQLNSLEHSAAFAIIKILELARNAVWVFVSYGYLEFVHPNRAQVELFK